MSLLAIVVEDSPTIRDNLAGALEELVGVRVIAFAETAGQAIEDLADHAAAWQLLIVDLFLKEGSGLTVLRACQGRAAHQRVVVLTNYATNEMRQRCKALGADGMFDKSTELEAFFDFCRTAG
ncbi:MAG: response regulator [Variovorax sp.]